MAPVSFRRRGMSKTMATLHRPMIKPLLYLRSVFSNELLLGLSQLLAPKHKYVMQCLQTYLTTRVIDLTKEIKIFYQT